MKKAVPRVAFWFLIALIVISVLEVVADKISGNGDGMIESFYIHDMVFFLQVCFCIYVFVSALNYCYLKYFKGLPTTDALFVRTGKLTVMFLFFLFFLVILEMLSRIFLPNASAFDRIYPVENARAPEPYVMFKGVPGTRTGFDDEYNVSGYRGSYPPMPKDAREYRIIMIGGSACWEGNPTLAQLMENQFRNKGFPNVKVYNFGVVSAVSSMELMTLFKEVIELSPDFVIMYDGANDIICPLKYDPRPGFPFNFLVYENNPFLLREYPSMQLLMYSSNVCRLIFRNFFEENISHINTLREKAGYQSDAWQEKIASVYCSNITRANTECRLRNIKFCCFIQPIIFYKTHKSTREIAISVQKKYLADHYRQTHDRILLTLDSDTAFYKPPVFDFSGFYSKSSFEVFRDEVHTLQSAKDTLALELFNKIKHAF